MTPGNRLTFLVCGLWFVVPIGLNDKPGTIDHKPAQRARGAAAGFTLLELMIVVTIIGILATISQPMYRNAVTKAREAALLENLFVMRDAIDKYYADNEKYPESLEDLATKKYIRGVPRDPITGSNATWQVVQETDEKGAQAGISDVKSGSDVAGTDGRKYSEW